MIYWIVCFTLCSGLLLLVYHILLSREQLFRFNRFYLLSSLVFAMLVSFIKLSAGPQYVTTYIKPVLATNIQPVIVTPVKIQTVTQPTVHFNQVDWLIAIYALITLLLLIRLLVNLYRIFTCAAQSEKSGQLRLTDQPIQPHSFFNCIFLNRKEYQAGLIRSEVIFHEQAHARQLHSLDVLFIELLQALFWFNPFVPFYRRAIQLNHEYLADEAVVKQYPDTAEYQYLILDMSGHQTVPATTLSSEFNYQTIKNRLVMLNKTTSRVAGVCRQLAILPAIALATFLFGQKVNAQGSGTADSKAGPNQVAPASSDVIVGTSKTGLWPFESGSRPVSAAKDAPASVMNEYADFLKKYKLSVNSGITTNITQADRSRMHELFTEMSVSQQDSQFVRFVKATPPHTITMNDDMIAMLKDAKRYSVSINGKAIDNAKLADYKPSELAVKQMIAMRSIVKVNILTKAQSDEENKKFDPNQPDHLIRFIRFVNPEASGM